jgi:magnesium chelatase subunit I
MNIQDIRTVGQLKASGYQPKTIKQELRDNLILALKEKRPIFEGIYGFEHTVIPDIQRAILSRHNILLLGLRGQAKTRIARMLVHLLDEYIPVLEESELNEDPLVPMTAQSRELLSSLGDTALIKWVHRSERYVEKLATPDVSVADLIGDIDPIKAATQKLTYSDEGVIHYGIIPRSHRSIFVINELPDLQARIQVSLFNILQEGDIQIRGFKLRLPLDIQFIFTANPEDYTNRGSIITPLKDRIESQILTHYPESLEIAKQITAQETQILPEQSQMVHVPDILSNILERMVFIARDSELVDEKSGVSSRLSISAYENLVSSAERRVLINKENFTQSRLGDLWGIIPAITGKIELVYEGEQEGPYDVALHLIGKAIKEEFLQYFPNPDRLKKNQKTDPFMKIKKWFSEGNTVDLVHNSNNELFEASLDSVEGLSELITELPDIDFKEKYAYMELALHGLGEFNVIQKEIVENQLQFRDLLADMLRFDDGDED